MRLFCYVFDTTLERDFFFSELRDSFRFYAAISFLAMNRSRLVFSCFFAGGREIKADSRCFSSSTGARNYYDGPILQKRPVAGLLTTISSSEF